VLVIGSYKGQSSPLYIVNTVGKVVEVGCSAVGRAVLVKLGLAVVRQQVLVQL
jgi:DNA-binding IclR family transcriptional regulator